MSIDDATKKRKHGSDAERMALELSKINLIHNIQFKFSIDKDRIFFSDTACQSNQRQCTWRDEMAVPGYCAKVHLTFVTSLPYRRYLTRYSVWCPECYDSRLSAVHMYCAYCDEVLTGSIAAAGGKISDHLITVRHIYRQALALKDSMQIGSASSIGQSLAKDYITKLEQWSEKVRYPIRTAVKRIHFEQVLRELRQYLFGLCPPQICLPQSMTVTPKIILADFSSW